MCLLALGHSSNTHHSVKYMCSHSRSQSTFFWNKCVLHLLIGRYAYICVSNSMLPVTQIRTFYCRAFAVNSATVGNVRHIKEPK